MCPLIKFTYNFLSFDIKSKYLNILEIGKATWEQSLCGGHHKCIMVPSNYELDKRMHKTVTSVSQLADISSLLVLRKKGWNSLFV